MTVSMPTTRLSSVITGCGGKETTCSRRSISGLTRSTNGTISARPGSSVRWKRPSRSTTPARACGTIRTPMPAMTSTKTRTTISAMMPPDIWLLFGHERDRAPDLDYLYALPRLEDLVLVEAARAPVLPVELDDAAVLRRALEDQGLPADEPPRPGADLRWHAAVGAGDRSQPGERDDGRDERDGQRHGRSTAERGDE